MHLKRTLTLRDYFTLAFGTMVGVGWLVVMDDWLGRGGPGGVMLAFLAGAVMLTPVAWVYARLVPRFPQAGGEVVYAQAAGFPAPLVFLTGWLMTLAYLIVCPWEAVAIGRLAAYVFPGLDTLELYRIAGRPVFLPRLMLGLGLVGWVGWINYRGIRLSATLQNRTTAFLLAATAIFTVLGFSRGHVANLQPLFPERGLLVGTLMMLQVVPYFMTGFESVSKSSEEARDDLAAGSFAKAMYLALAVGGLFYVTVTAAVSVVAPWRETAGASFSTAVAFERAFGSHGVVDLILLAALASLVKIYNGNLVAGTRLIYALGRAGALPAALGNVQAQWATPGAAIVAATVASAAATLLGDAVLVPITEVASLASACGWLAACLACLRLESRGRAIAALGALVSLALAMMKVLPFVPGHFGLAEVAALGIWLAVGAGAYCFGGAGGRGLARFNS